MKDEEQSKSTIAQFKDVSRYTRWINRMDELDESLAPSKRKAKWLILLGTLFLSFVLSFILFPSANLEQEAIGGPVLMHQPSTKIEKQAAPSFEMPTDSFENLLNRQIYENNHHVLEEK